MDIFISWSGPRSRAVTEALTEYLPMIVNAFSPWLSSADIDKGARWNSDLAAALATSKAGIICLTPNNLTAPYVLFESGALSKTFCLHAADRDGTERRKWSPSWRQKRDSEENFSIS
jgi:hypothetical protein